jgi:hypothetical protein
MPLAKIYVNDDQYDEARLTNISEAVQAYPYNSLLGHACMVANLGEPSGPPPNPEPLG